jgi:hypothetical protein
LKQAPRNWYKHLTNILKGLQLSENEKDPCVYFNVKKLIYLAIYVDDMILATCQSKDSVTIQNTLAQHFEINKAEELNWFLGMKITRNRSKCEIYLSQEWMILDMLKKYGFENVNPARTPMAENEELTKEKPSEHDPRVFDKPYREIVGTLIYILQGTQPNIPFAVSKVSQFLDAPKESHWRAVKQFLRYLKGTASFCLTVGGLESNQAIVTYADADWARDTDDRHSISCYALFFGPSLISWKTKKQPTVTLSTTEAEYYALTTSMQEYLWTEQFLMSMGFCLELGTIYNDNMGCISIIKNNKKDTHTKHIDIKHHAIWQQLQHLH